MTPSFPKHDTGLVSETSAPGNLYFSRVLKNCQVLRESSFNMTRGGGGGGGMKILKLEAGNFSSPPR